MAATLKPGWSKPSTILLASEIPANERVFGCALAQAAEVGSDLTLLHVSETPDAAASETSGIRWDGELAGGAEIECLEPLAERARNIGIHCEIVVRLGLAADQILRFLDEREIDRVVMGSRSPGPIGKLLVGSVAEAVLRRANVPVCIVGPNVVEGTYRNVAARKILCAVSTREVSHVVVSFSAEVAAAHNASLILHQVIQPQECADLLADRTIAEIEAELPSLVPVRLKHKVKVRTRVALGDPTEELLHGGRAQQANLIVLGAQDASHFAAITHASTVYKVLAYAHCPVITLSPIVLGECGVKKDRPRASEAYLAGVF